MATIAAVSTPNATGGLGVLRIAGDEAISIAENVFRSANGRLVSDMAGYTCAYGNIFDNDIFVDDVVLTVFRKPNSYTGDDIVEISCHGGVYICKKILSLLYRYGAKPAEAGEFTRRAFENGKMSLSQAEAVMQAIHAEGEAALQEANYARSGKLSALMRNVQQEITGLLSALAYWMDDPEESPPELEPAYLIATITGLRDRLCAMADEYENGRVFREGVRTALLGRPNAGKSSVMNWLTGMRRSIVTEIPGTTRDVVTESVRIGSYTLLLADTAGIRISSDQIERLGIEQSYVEAEMAQLLLYVVDATVGIADEDVAFLERYANKKRIVLWNKTDLSDAPPPQLSVPVVSCAAKLQRGDDSLLLALRQILGDVPTEQRPTLITERQRVLVSRAADCLLEAIRLIHDEQPVDMLYELLQSAAFSLGEIDGDLVSDAVIDGVFRRFCVGK